ncbi:hypothetical protein NMG60_11009212 [Bertholletia excelsa]
MDPAANTADTENETPPAVTVQPIKSLSFTNGGAVTIRKNSSAHHHHHHQLFRPSAYGECLKNHAAAMGGHAVDGCGEFMPSPSATPADPTSLKCAACGCHRNFHRRDDDDCPSVAPHFLDFRRRSSPSPSPSPPPYHALLALRDDHHHFPVATPATPTAAKVENPSGRKRFRTKFSQEQKEKMLSFSEKLGWKMQKSDEGLVEEFCNQVGVGKGVLKVWMHNNKNTFGKRDINFSISNSNNNDRVVNFDDINNGASTTTNSLNHNESSNGDHRVSSEGSPSSP